MDKFKPPHRELIAKIVGNDRYLIRNYEAAIRAAGETLPSAQDATDIIIIGVLAALLAQQAINVDVEIKTDATNEAVGVDDGDTDLGEFLSGYVPSNLSVKSALDFLGLKISELELEFLKFVENKSDLPAPVGGVITLEDEKSYFFTREVDLAGDRIVCASNTVILGTGPENCRIISTGLAATDALITSAFSVTLSAISFTHDLVLDLDGSALATAAIDCSRINFLDCANIGTVKGYSNFIGDIVGVLNSANWIFDGTFGTVAFSDTIFVGIAGQTTLIFADTAVITRRIRFTDSAFVAFGGATALDVSTAATIPNEGYILRDCNFSGGATYLAGITYTSDIARFNSNRGIDNTAAIAAYSAHANTTATALTANTPAKAVVATVGNVISQKFDLTDNRATYAGSLDRTFIVTATISLTATTGPEVGVYIAKNGAIDDATLVVAELGIGNRASNITTMGIFTAEIDDFFEVWIENRDNGQDVTASDIIVSVIEAGG